MIPQAQLRLGEDLVGLVELAHFFFGGRVFADIRVVEPGQFPIAGPHFVYWRSKREA
jgi:hypothetical protein